MAKILIIGSNSFVGNNFIKMSRFRDVGEISLFETTPEEIDFSSVDVVIHLVAIVHQSKKIPETEYTKINKDLCLKVANFAKTSGVKQFLFLSTVKVYGNSDVCMKPLDESSPCTADDFYGKSKYEAEVSLRKLEDNNFTVSIIRTPIVYGKGVKANMLSIIKLTNRFPVLPLGKINNRRSFTFVGNLVAYLDAIIEKRASGIFIAKDVESLSTTELVELISKYLGKRTKLIFLPDIVLKVGKIFFPKITDRLFNSFELDNTKTIDTLNFKTPFTAEEGIKIMVSEYKNQKS